MSVSGLGQNAQLAQANERNAHIEQVSFTGANQRMTVALQSLKYGVANSLCDSKPC